MIPYEKWQPLSINEVLELFEGAPFQWALAGGYAIELFLGESIRSHSDMDVIVFRDEQLSIQQWLKGWQCYAADPPGTLRLWNESEFLPPGIHDIWLHYPTSDAWQFQLMVTETDGEDWVSRRSPLIRGKRDELITRYRGIPYICVEVQLMYKAKNRRPKDEQDFQACLPRMNAEAKHWLKEKLNLLYPEGHEWIEALTMM